jgi:hypothetical protein
MDTLDIYNSFFNAWVQDKDPLAEKALQEFVESDDYLELPYAIRNKSFITASKLAAFERNELYAKYKYIDLIPEPISEETDAMIVGTAIDDMLTYGDLYFSKQYVVVARRTEAEQTRYLGKTLLTNTMNDQIRRAANEYRLNPYFPQDIKKHTIIWLAFGKYPCKAELDHFEKGVEFGDVKTVGNVDQVEPSKQYLLQMQFYFQGILEKHLQKLPCRIFAVDRYADFSRSEHWRFSVPLLEQGAGRINNLIMRWNAAVETGMFNPPDMRTEEGRKAMRSSSYYTICPLARAASPLEL